MTEWAAKRFWSDVTLEAVGHGHAIRLDGRAVRTPARTELVLPTEGLAAIIADEWRAQSERIDPLTMPATRSANAALDKVAPQRAAVEDMIAAYAETDLLCYRAVAPDALVERQATVWDPLLEWAEQRFGARLATTAGVMPVAQESTALTALRAGMADMSAFQIVAFHDLVSLSGSFVLGLAVCDGHQTAAEAWEVSRLDEEWQIAQWGRDEDADAQAALKRDAYLHAGRFFHAATPGDPLTNA